MIAPVFLGDTRYLHQAEPCPACGDAMAPRVFFGAVVGWRCATCTPVSAPHAYGGNNAHEQGATNDA